MIEPRWSRKARILWLAGLLATGACDGVDLLAPDDLEPEDLQAEYVWMELGWAGDDLRDPVGQHAVVLTWLLPQDWRGEVFRVYSRPDERRRYRLIATVTSCGDSLCQYTDWNVFPETAYDYYVAAVSESSGRESESRSVAVLVPPYDAPAPPSPVAAVPLDGAVLLTWEPTGAERYRVFLRQSGGESVFFEIGQTDGSAFYDDRAENGTTYGYRIAAVGEDGHVSRQGELVTVTPGTVSLRR